MRTGFRDHGARPHARRAPPPPLRPADADGVSRPWGAASRDRGDDEAVTRSEDALARGVPRDASEVPGAVPRAAETWLRIVQVHDRITRRVDSALHRQYGIALTAF